MIGATLRIEPGDNTGTIVTCVFEPTAASPEPSHG